MNRIHKFDDLDTWHRAVYDRGLDWKRRDGKGEDPFTHYSAYNPRTTEQVGYFGHANGADCDFGVIGNTKQAFDGWMSL
jgi:hypothetical protein